MMALIRPLFTNQSYIEVLLIFDLSLIPEIGVCVCACVFVFVYVSQGQ